MRAKSNHVGILAASGLRTSLACLILTITLLCSGCSGLVSGNAGGGGGTPTPLSISGVAASNATLTGVAIAWQTSVPANAQVQYGTTSSYGAVTPVDSTITTSHQVTLSGLKPGTTYHFRADSTDTKNNTAKSNDMTFATLADNTPPTVSITSPLPNVTIAGTATVNANASDDVAVASVQFKVDNANTGTALTAAPYSYALNTNGLSNGNHILTAVATDTSGNTATSTGVAVNVNNTASAPSILSLNPTSGVIGTPVTISGANFGATQGTSTVTFNGIAATPTSWNATSMVAAVPAGATTGNVVVTVGGAASNGMTFTVTVPGPSIASLSPTSGVAGTPVTITGANFGTTQGTSTVKFNGVTATPTSWSATSIVAAVPAGATTGNVVVTVGGAASNGMTFTVTVPGPSIARLNPTSGVVGTPVTITGANFGATQGTSTVKFNGVTAAPTSWSATSIVAAVPAGTTTGNVVVTVGGAASNGMSFTLQSDTTAPVVTITAPANGATVSGTITLSATATDPDSPVSFVQFRVDGINIGTQLTTAPYSISFDTTTIANGSHAFTAVAQDPSANQGASAAVVITISNSTGTGAVPTLLQSKVDAAEANPLSFIHTWKTNLPNPSQAGNCLVVVVTAGNSSPPITVSDDKGNTWNSTTMVSDVPSNNSLEIFYALNVVGGTQLITVNFGSGNFDFDQVMLLEFNNVAAVGALDAQVGQTTSGTSLSSGSMTTTADGDLIIGAAVVDGFGSQTAPMTWTAGSGFTFAATSDTNYMAVQYQIQGTHGAINSSMTSSLNGSSAITKAIALKASAGSQGAPNPAGIRVRKVDVESLGVTPYGTYSGTTWTFQLAVDGNLIAAGWTGKATSKVTSVTSNPPLTWVSTATSSDGITGSLNSVQWWYAAGASPGTLYTITFNGSPPGSFTVNLFDISGAAASPFDTYANAVGYAPRPNTGETGVPVNGPLITPSTSNGLILAVQQEDQHTVVNASPGYFEAYDVGVYSGPSGEGDQGLMAYYNPNTLAVQVVWIYNGYEAGVTGGAAAYDSQAIAFKAGP
jgi:hypothetical protein